MLSHVAEQLRLADGRRIEIGGRERSGDAPDAHGTGYLTEFRLESGLPVWRYDVEGLIIEKRVFLPHMQNTVHIAYELMSAAPTRVELALRPSVNFRAQEAPVSEPLGWPYEFRAVDRQYEIALPGSALPPLRLTLSGGRRDVHAEGQADRQRAVSRRREPRLSGARRAVEPRLLHADARSAANRATLTASTESFETMRVAGAGGGARRRTRPAAPSARAGGAGSAEGVAAELVLAADQFIITPAGRTRRSSARPRLRRRGADGDRGLSLVHRLGPRHDDQPRRADARDRPRTSKPATSCGRSRITSATA